MGRVILFLVAITLVISSGVAHGLRTDRWGSPRDRGPLLALDRVPLAIGDWRGRAEAVDPRMLDSAELDGCLMRGYENTRTGESVSLFIAYGRPGPVCVHSPNICYVGAGYRPARSGPVKVPIPSGRRGAHAELRWTDFEKPGPLPAERLRIFWSWSATGDWKTPDYPRLAFGLQPSLYKLYVVRRGVDQDERAEDDRCLDFVRVLVPELEKSLFSAAHPVQARHGAAG
jgi:hypothetical protein